MKGYNETMTVQIEPASSRGGFSFSKREIKELAISGLVLSGAFTLAINGGIYGFNLFSFLFYLPVAIFTITTAFVLHELSHKYLAQKYGAWSEYRMSKQGLGLAVLTSLFGFVYAAPGAVMINGYITQDQNGKISVAGPVTNLVLGVVLFSFSLALFDVPYVPSILSFAAYINFFLAAFNLIPLGPLDGKKVWRWNKSVYLLVAGLAVFFLLVMWGVIDVSALMDSF